MTVASAALEIAGRWGSKAGGSPVRKAARLFFPLLLGRQRAAHVFDPSGAEDIPIGIQGIQGNGQCSVRACVIGVGYHAYFTPANIR